MSQPHTKLENQTPSRGIRTLSEMAESIENFYHDNLFDLDKIRKPYLEIVDQELVFIDELFDSPIINRLISPEGYSPQHREIYPYHLFQDILKITKYPEISGEEVLHRRIFWQSKKAK